jgi:hypothetical protein
MRKSAKAIPITPTTLPIATPMIAPVFVANLSFDESEGTREEGLGDVALGEAK